ncbi:MAG TPA: zinc ribbon domain-containing protein [Ktedonobacterales bacterium]|nr:zinc ribbon domain-containing protein [Ktedonobacterales bacterium]
MAASALTCEQCGAPVDEDATVCFTCGAAIGDVETPTQPVPVPRFLRTKILTDVTLLPAEELPALPGRGAEGPAHGDEADHDAQAPANGDGASAPGRPADAPTMPARSGPGAEGPEPAPLVARVRTTETLARIAAVPRQLATDATALARTARQASRLSWALLASSAVVIALGLVVLGYRLIPGAIPAATVYHDPQGRFSFLRPALWQTTPASDGVTLTDATGISSARVTVTLAPGQETAAEAADLVGASDGVSQATSVRAGGATWEERDGTVPLADGTTRHVTVYVTEHDSSLYILECSTLAATYPSTNQLIFQPLLRSFAFG